MLKVLYVLGLRHEYTHQGELIHIGHAYGTIGYPGQNPIEVAPNCSSGKQESFVSRACAIFKFNEEPRGTFEPNVEFHFIQRSQHTPNQ